MVTLSNTPPSLKAWEDGWCEISLTGQKFTLIQQLPVVSCVLRATFDCIFNQIIGS